MSTYKQVASVLASPPRHWVGDGFPVSSVFSPRTVGTSLSPFVLMDYAAPVEFEPASEPRGVDSHPHRGFETVTVVFQGELEHRDTAGNQGSIGPGDVQWMTAASGVLHEEKHSAAFTKAGGTFEVAQLWVNLPRKDKMTAPRYQTLLRDEIPTITLPASAGTARLIAGDFGDARGAAKTFTPVVLWDMKLHAGKEVQLPVPDDYHLAVFVRNGTIAVGENLPTGAQQLVVFSRAGSSAVVRAQTDADLIVVGGQPLDEPVVAYGPFVMNTQQEIHEAIADVQAGKLGTLA